MARVSNALKIYMLLQVRGKMKAKEIARELGVTSRMVKIYIEDLQEANIYISSERGRYGGYYLESHMNLAGMAIREEELDSLKRAGQVIRTGSYHYASDLDSLISKIVSKQNDFQEIAYYAKSVAPVAIKEDKKVWQDINKAILEKRKLKIIYSAIGKDRCNIKERIIHPYGICDHKGAAYIYGYCQLRKKPRTFKICRIVNHEILKENFSIDKKINFRQTINDSFGIYNDDPINVKLKIDYPMSQIVKEKIYSPNQKIEEIDDQSIYFEARMRGYTEIKTWVMGMGSLVEVVEPRKLKDEIVDEARKVIATYQ